MHDLDKLNRERRGTETAHRKAASAMLAALDDLANDHVIKPYLMAGGYWGQVRAAIARAEAAGIKTEG